MKRLEIKTDFKLNLSPELKIQREEQGIETEPEPIGFSTPLKKKK